MVAIVGRPMIKARILAGLVGLLAVGAGCSKDDSPLSAAAEAPAEPEPVLAPAPVGPSATTSPSGASPVPASAVASASASPSASDAPLAHLPPHASASAPALVKAAPTCGDKPLPACPLNAWMKANTSPAVIAEDFDALATALEKVGTFAPDGYPNWASVSHDGADAARAQSLEGVKAACRGCHNQYKDKYKREMRDRPI
jgi:hypothetical protein